MVQFNLNSNEVRISDVVHTKIFKGVIEMW